LCLWRGDLLPESLPWPPAIANGGLYFPPAVATGGIRGWAKWRLFVNGPMSFIGFYARALAISECKLLVFARAWMARLPQASLARSAPFENSYARFLCVSSKSFIDGDL